MKKNAFTMAEIFAVLTLMGVLLAVLVPVCMDSMPNTKVLKLKKANTTLTSIINNLLNTDKYYKGDLGIKADGKPVLASDYLCNTMTDIMQIKKANCKSNVPSTTYSGEAGESVDFINYKGNPFEKLDSICKALAPIAGEEIVSADGIVFFEAAGITYGDSKNDFYLTDSSQEYYVYKTFCVDVDGNGKGEEPFGFGIRVDGRIIAGARASQWLKKNSQGK